MSLIDQMEINKICIIGIILGVIIISGCVNQQPAPPINDKPIDCKIKSPIFKIEGLKRVSSSIVVSGFQGDENQVSWSSDNHDIATLNSSTGSSNMIINKNVGTTTIYATDNAVGPDCKISIEVTVKSLY